MIDQFSRTQLLFGKEGMERLHAARVAVFGVGGVGGCTVEALARSGVGTLDLIDDDRVCITNINRQILATRETVGQYKVDAVRERVLSINPKAQVNGKLELIERAQWAGTPVISCMGAANKLDPSALEVADIYKTSVCPLARVMHRELRRRGIRRLKVVYSKEPPMTPLEDLSVSCRTHCVCPPGTVRKCTARRQIPGSNAFVPPAAGLLIAAEVVKDLLRSTPWDGRNGSGAV